VTSRVKLTCSLLSLGLIASLLSPLCHASSKDEESAKAGAALYRDKGCAYCHGVGGVGTKKAPPLADLWQDKSITTEKMTDQILNGGQKMPPFRDSVTDDEVTQLIAYLRAKKKPEPPPAESETPAASPQ
jgi:mono/diheme cytochrome c family protein